MGFLKALKEKFPEVPDPETIAADEDLMKFLEPTKTGRKKMTPEERRGQYDEHKCDARIWKSAGKGMGYDNIQCNNKKILVDGELKCFCKKHQAFVGDNGDFGWWLGKITEPRPEEPVGPPSRPRLHVWNTDKDGNLVEKAKKTKKTPTKKKKEKKASEEMTLDELRALLAQKQRIEDLKEKEEEEGQEEKEDDGVETVIVDGVEYQLNREDKIVIDPEDMEIMGTWNAEEGKIDFEDEEAEKKHQERV